jgi:2-C-methyl-D-erythritol 4-phosphate cytidylyltransferase
LFLKKFIYYHVVTIKNSTSNIKKGMSFSVIITAGGIGKRMGSAIPKQFIEVSGLPILMHTILCFHRFDSRTQIIITLPNDWKSYWEELLITHSFTVPHIVVDGGVERYDSIKNALSVCEFNLIAVHDGVRPLVSNETIQNCLDLATDQGSAIPTLPIKESLRKTDGFTTKSLERKEYLTVQTPQIFTAEMLKNAYNIPFHEGITDDASLVEEAGFSVGITTGNEENIKITTQFDLKIVSLLLK